MTNPQPNVAMENETKTRAQLPFDPSRSFAPVPEDQPEQQRAICMIKGKLIIVDAKKNEGVLKVKKQLFPCVFTGRLKPAFMMKQVNKDLCFNAWPRDLPSTMKSPSKLLLQLHSFRKGIAKESNGLCEIRGHIQNIQEGEFSIGIYSKKTEETYLIPVLGDCPGQANDLFKIEGILTPQGLNMLGNQLIKAHA